MSEFKTRPGPLLSFNKSQSNDDSQRKPSSDGFAFTFATPKRSAFTFDAPKEANPNVSIFQAETPSR